MVNFEGTGKKRPPLWLEMYLRGWVRLIGLSFHDELMHLIPMLEVKELGPMIYPIYLDIIVVSLCVGGKLGKDSFRGNRFVKAD